MMRSFGHKNTDTVTFHVLFFCSRIIELNHSVESPEAAKRLNADSNNYPSVLLVQLMICTSNRLRQSPKELKALSLCSVFGHVIANIWIFIFQSAQCWDYDNYWINFLIRVKFRFLVSFILPWDWEWALLNSLFLGQRDQIHCSVRV